MIQENEHRASQMVLLTVAAAGNPCTGVSKRLCGASKTACVLLNMSGAKSEAR